MGFFKNQLDDVVEWNESQPGVLFWKWTNQEIKKGSVLIVRPGQSAIFLYNGRVEGVFENEGRFDIESQIIPFLSTLAGFRFGFNSGLRAEVVFINKKQILGKWGTKNPIALPAEGLPGGMPVRAFGTYNCKIADASTVIDTLAGIRQNFTVDDVRERIMGSLDMLVMQWIAKEGKDIFNLQIYASNIAKGIESDLDMDLRKIGIAIEDFRIESFSYPEEVKKMQEKAAAQAMIGDVNKYQQVAVADGMTNGTTNNVAGDMMSMAMGMNMAQQMMNGMNNNNNAAPQAAPAAAPVAGGAIPKFCPNCGQPTNGMKFCGNCGSQLG